MQFVLKFQKSDFRNEIYSKFALRKQLKLNIWK